MTPILEIDWNFLCALHLRPKVLHLTKILTNNGPKRILIEEYQQKEFGEL